MIERLAVAVLLVVATLGVLFMASGPELTGMYSWNTVKYESCQYLDQDQYGYCMRIERQVPPCSPPETAYRYGQGAYGWFLRLCTYKNDPVKF